MWAATRTPEPARGAVTPSDEVIRAALLAYAARRGAGRSFCPSEPARELATDWRALMPRLRAQAALLQDAGLLSASQRGAPVRADQARGPIRLALP